jgi:CheY-like chemotaxis protein
MVKSDATQIDQILVSLCGNAKDAIQGSGTVVIESENTTVNEEFCQGHPGIVPGQYVKLSMADNGCGMDGSTLARVFDPFFTTKEFGHGMGLGLATVYGAVMQNNGCITVDSGLNKGTKFSIFLPRMAESAGLLESEKHHDGAAQGGEKILLVDDEPALLKLTTLLLEKQGYVVLPASTPAQAFRWVQEWGDQIQLLITDVVMPEMNGRDLAQEIHLHYPKLKCLFMSGYTADIITEHGVLAEGVAFIQKPFSMGAIAAKVQDCLGTAAPTKDSATNA